MDFDELVANGKVKRIFRAKHKITIPGIVSHLTQRAAGKEPLFIEETDYLFMLAELKEIAKQRSLDTGAALMKAFADYYHGTRPAKK